MKILYVLCDRGIRILGNVRQKGASIHVRELVNALSDLGHDITLMMPVANGQAPDSPKAHIIALPINQDTNMLPS